MNRTSLTIAGLLALCASPAFAQVIVSSPVVTYYSPAPVVTTYSPTVVASPVVSYSAPVTVSRPVTTYYAPAVSPVTTYYAPAPTYVAPTTAYYAPVTTYYGGPVVTPTVVGRPVVVGRSAFGTLTPYVPGQPVRNALRFSLP